MSGNYRWVPGRVGVALHPNAVIGGTDADGDAIYVGRAEHEGEKITAKIIPTKSICSVSYGGEEVPKERFEVLVPVLFTWVPAEEGVIPPNAVETGKTADGSESLYIGRVTEDEHVHTGKIHPSHGCCYYPEDGEEKNSREYQCLAIV